MFDKIKQIKELREQANTMKQALAQETVQGEAHHGQIAIVMDGNQEVLSVEIAPELLDSDKKEDLQEYIKEAINDAIKKVQRVMAQKMQGLGGLNMPRL